MGHPVWARIRVVEPRFQKREPSTNSGQALGHTVLEGLEGGRALHDTPPFPVRPERMGHPEMAGLVVGFAEGQELGVEELVGEVAGEGFDGGGLLRG